MWEVYVQTGQMPERLAARPEDPEILLYLWEWYWGIRAGERRDEWSGVVVPMNYEDIHYWQAVTGNRLNESEIRLLFKWDQRRREILAEGRDGNGSPKTRSRQ